MVSTEREMLRMALELRKVSSVDCVIRVFLRIYKTVLYFYVYGRQSGRYSLVNLYYTNLPN